MPIQEYNNIFYPNGFNSTLEEYEKNKIIKANNEKYNFGLLRKLSIVRYRLLENLLNSDVISMQCISEYAITSLNGAHYCNTIKHLLVNLKKMNHLAFSNHFKNLIDILSYAQKIQGNIFSLRSKAKLAQKLKSDFQLLKN